MRKAAIEKIVEERQADALADQFRRYREETPRIHAAAISTDANGNATFTFPAGFFAAAPVVSLVVIAPDARDYLAKATSVSASACVVKVRRSRTLPDDLTDLEDLEAFDPWETPGVVSVHLHAHAV